MPFLLYGLESQELIKGISLSNHTESGSFFPQSAIESIVPISKISPPFAIDFNRKEKKAYFSFYDNAFKSFQIGVQNFDGTARENIKNNLESCNSIAFDWIGKNLYYTSSDRNTVNVLKLSNSSIFKTLIREESLIPKSIALNPISGTMFYALWSSHNNNGSIINAWMDGTHRNVIVDNKKLPIYWPSSLTLDEHFHKLYWCDLKLSFIERCDLNGENREIIFIPKSNTFSIFSFGLFNDNIYLSEPLSDSILTISLKNASMLNEYVHYLMLYY